MAIGSFIVEELCSLTHLIHPGLERDVVGLLAAAAVVVPIMKKLGVPPPPAANGTSPIIGFLLIGLLFGPTGIDFVHNEHEAHILAEFGIVFFLFEMGLELSVAKVLSMKFDVFGLGFAQYGITTLAACGLTALLMPSLPVGAIVAIGGALALSTSAFVLQLIKDKGQLGARYGRASMGVLLFQDMAVVPLLVVVPLLTGAGGGLGPALAKAAARSVLALSSIVVLGHVVLNRVFTLVLTVNSIEAFLSVTFATVLLSSAITEGLGLSNTLGAFFGGVLLAETSYRHQIETAIEPFRGMLLGLFFVTVGFQINLKLLLCSWRIILPFVFGVLLLKAAIILASCKVARIPDAASVKVATLLAPGGEFAFVVFGLAERLGLISKHVTSLLITSVALSMALTPMLGRLGEVISERIEAQKSASDSSEEVKADNEAIIKQTARSNSFIAICGYGKVGKVLCDVFDSEGAFSYIALEMNPDEIVEARAAGLPVFLADCTQKEVLTEFQIDKARLVVVGTSERELATAITRAVREVCPDVPVVVRAANEEHQEELQELGVTVILPSLPSREELLSLPFSCAVLRRLGIKETEIDGIMEERQRQIELPWRKNLLSAFRFVDTDDSGMLDKEELRRALQNLGKVVSDEEFEAAFKAADMDGNGYVDYTEFSTMKMLE